MVKTALSKAKKAEKLKKYSEAVDFYDQVLSFHPNHPVAIKRLRNLNRKPKGPSQSCLASLVSLYSSGDVLRTESYARELLEKYPDSFVVCHVLGAALQSQGRLEESVNMYDRAIEINPIYVDAYCNRADALSGLGRYAESIESCDSAIKINSSSSEAYYNRGNALGHLELYDAAADSYKKAVKLNPRFSDAFCNLGNVLKELGDFSLAIESYESAININPGSFIYYCNYGALLGDCNRCVDAVELYSKAININGSAGVAFYGRGIMYRVLGVYDKMLSDFRRATEADTENAIFLDAYLDALLVVGSGGDEELPVDYLINSVGRLPVDRKKISRIVLDELIKNPSDSMLSIIMLCNDGRLNNDIYLTLSLLLDVPEFVQAVEMAQVQSVFVENILTQIRGAVLDKVLVEDVCDDRYMPFYMSLSMSCFFGEYVFYENKNESDKVVALEKKIEYFIDSEGQYPVSWIVLLGAYRKIYKYKWAISMVHYEWPENITKFVVSHIVDPVLEESLQSSINRLPLVEDDVSKMVRYQYEENPYPRWVDLVNGRHPVMLQTYLNQHNLVAVCDFPGTISNPSVLIAGCGTGRQAIGSALMYKNSCVEAIDISLSSLCYAKRMSDELSVNNIEFYHGDIIGCKGVDKKYDVIECVGVLHHMKSPFLGLEILADKLKVGGLMKLGLYSDIARSDIKIAKREINSSYMSSDNDVRQFRRDLMEGDILDGDLLKKISSYSDFYSLSECRDLLFHVHEIRFDLVEISALLGKLGLVFLGFEFSGDHTNKMFRKIFPGENDVKSLSCWHQYELNYPDTFRGMYQFWVQKL